MEKGSGGSNKKVNLVSLLGLGPTKKDDLSRAVSWVHPIKQWRSRGRKGPKGDIGEKRTRKAPDGLKEGKINLTRRIEEKKSRSQERGTKNLKGAIHEERCSVFQGGRKQGKKGDRTFYQEVREGVEGSGKEVR